MLNDKKGISLIVLILVAVVVIGVGAISIVLVINKDNSATNENILNTQNDGQISTSPNNNAEMKENNINSSTKEITLKVVQNYPESPESDFEVVDHGNGDVELLRYLGTSEIVVIPETWHGKKITTISSFVFANASPVKAIKLSKSVNTLMMSSFAMNKSLEIVVCGEGLTTIGEGAFQECSKLHTVVLNDGLTKISGASFGGCKSLTKLEIPESVTEIQPMTFYNRPENFKIVGKSGSLAEQYAKKEGIEFQVSK